MTMAAETESAPVEARPLIYLAEYDSPADVMHAAEAVRDAGYKRWDVHTRTHMCMHAYKGPWYRITLFGAVYTLSNCPVHMSAMHHKRSATSPPHPAGICEIGFLGVGLGSKCCRIGAPGCQHIVFSHVSGASGC